MGARLEELGWRQTPMGVISLRRRWDPMFKTDVYEVKLDDDFLMSSLFTVAEEAVAELALAEHDEGLSTCWPARALALANSEASSAANPSAVGCDERTGLLRFRNW